jgi:tetraacyldisaccharide 4'-kinase
VIGFSGIGHPEKFFITLKSLGANILSLKTFENHKPFKILALKRLINEAKINSAILKLSA